MKKTACIAMAFFAVSLCFTSCKKNEAAEGNVLVSPDEGGYTFEIPADWQVSDTDGMVSAFDPSDPTKANVTACVFDTGLDEAVSSEEYWKSYKEQFEATFTEMDVEKNEETKLSGIEARHVFYSVDIGSDTFSCQTVIGVYGDNAYVITLTQGEKNDANESVYEDHTDEFKEIVKSFKIG